MWRQIGGRITIAVVVGILMLSASAAIARVPSIWLAELIKGADCIVLAKVDGLLAYEDLTVARAVPIRTLKGDAEAKRFYFVAGRTWACDVSAAERGEIALLFLTRAKSERVSRHLLGKPAARVSVKPLFFIAHAGSGRMPLRTVKGQPHVTVRLGDIHLPARIPTVRTRIQTAGAEAAPAGFVHSAALSDIEEAIRKSPAVR